MRRPPGAVLALAALGALVLHLPLLVLALFSFNAARFSAAWSGASLRWYRALLDRPEVFRALERSLEVGLAATLLATAAGTLLALAIARLAPRRRRGAEALLAVPIVTPEVVLGIALLVLFTGVGVPLGLGTVVLAHTSVGLPFVTVAVLARLDAMDRTLEEAALVLGADGWGAFRRVTLPLLWPGVLAGALLAFTLSFDDFVVTFFTSGPGTTTLPLLVYGMARRGVEPTINALSTLILVVTTALLWWSARLTRGAPAAPPSP